MGNDTWSSPAAVFGGLLLLLNAWMYWQNKKLLDGQKEHETMAAARFERTQAKVEQMEDECEGKP